MLRSPLLKYILFILLTYGWVSFYQCSCLAGESVHFYEEVQQLDKIPHNDHVRRIYMARHIIDHYITPGIIFFVSSSPPCLFGFLFHTVLDVGSTMEVNISHRSRQEILNAPDLTNPNLFNSALNELMHLMKMVSSWITHSILLYFQVGYFLTRLPSFICIFIVYEEFGEWLLVINLLPKTERRGQYENRRPWSRTDFRFKFLAQVELDSLCWRPFSTRLQPKKIGNQSWIGEIRTAT